MPVHTPVLPEGAVLVRRSPLRRALRDWLQTAPVRQPLREQEALAPGIPVPSQRLVGLAVGVALLGAAVALIALLVVLVWISAGA